MGKGTESDGDRSCTAGTTNVLVTGLQVAITHSMAGAQEAQLLCIPAPWSWPDVKLWVSEST